MTSLVLFDDGIETLAPLTDLRASFDLRTGALCTHERVVKQAGLKLATVCVPRDKEGCLGDWCQKLECPINSVSELSDIVFVNGRWTSLNLPLPRSINTALVDAIDGVAVARLDRAAAREFVASGCVQLPARVARKPATDARLLTHPWHILRQRDENMMADLQTLGLKAPRLKSHPEYSITVVGTHPVFMEHGSFVHPHVVFDTTAGPILLASGSSVRSMSVMVGPAYVGPHSVICNHAHIRAGTVIGPHCKVGGEVNGCTFQGNSNKAHSGYLGNSYVGEWVNLGADTVTSNLKNTYGEVRMQSDPNGPEEPTGMQFLGSVIGDHVKTAIGTRLSTGSCIHTGAMIALSKFTPKYVGPFAFLTDDGSEKYDFEKFRQVVTRVMHRREMQPTQAMLERLQQLHERV